MLYIFKSKDAGSLTMLQPSGEHMLEIIGKQPGPKGIIQPEQMPAAIAALEAAIAQEGPANGDPQSETAAVSLRQRASPFIDMLKRCHTAGSDIVWGV